MQIFPVKKFNDKKQNRDDKPTICNDFVSN